MNDNKKPIRKTPTPNSGKPFPKSEGFPASPPESQENTSKGTRPANKKSFKGTGADLFLSVDTPSTDTQDIQDTRTTLDTSDTSDTHIQKLNKSKGYYRLNLKLDIELKEYITDAAWSGRTTVTEYINNLIRADREERNKDTQDIQRGQSHGT